MKTVLGILCGLCCAAAWAQPSAESLTAWPYYKEITGQRELSLVTLDRDVLDKARPDAADLRLYDADGREIPYALRIRRKLETHSVTAGKEFNRAVEGSAVLASYDLGAGALEHNQVVIATAGDNFRRYAQVEGSSDGAQWVTLASHAILFRFAAGGRTVEQNAVSYPTSRYRYLRVLIDRDPQVDPSAPEITSLEVLRAVQERGEEVPYETTLGPREPEPLEGRPASVWRMDLGARVPVESLTLNIGNASFSRPFTLEVVDDPAGGTAIAGADLVRTEEHAAVPVKIEFQEAFARHLKLTVIDDRNPPLALMSVTAFGAARQLVFQSPGGSLRLYYGNPKAIAPHYDAARNLPTPSGATNAMLGPQHGNPTYHPEPKPFSERAPWVVYIVLIGACVALAAILVDLARKSARIAAS